MMTLMKRFALPCLLFFLAAKLASCHSADVLIMVRDQPGDKGFRSGDIVRVYTRAHIDHYWAQLDATGESKNPPWNTADRTKMPLSDTMLKEFLVVHIDDTLAEKMCGTWTKPEFQEIAETARPSTGMELESPTLQRKRAYKVTLGSLVSAPNLDKIIDKNQKIDLRSTVTISEKHVQKKAAVITP